MTAQDLIDRLNLQPHPEGGWYRQTWITTASSGARAPGTAIYYLLEADQRSIWHFYAGSPLILSQSGTAEGPATDHILGPSFADGEVPQIVVPKDVWQAAKSTGGWSLVGCTVSPGFRFEGFELAPVGFDIPRG